MQLVFVVVIVFFLKEIHNNLPFHIRLQDYCCFFFSFIFTYAQLSLPSSPPQLSLVFDKALPVVKQGGWSSTGNSGPFKCMACAHFRITYPLQPRLARGACRFFLLSLLAKHKTLHLRNIDPWGSRGRGTYMRKADSRCNSNSHVNFFISLQKLFLSIFLLQLGWVGERTQREVEADGCHKLHTAIEN